MSGIIQAGKDKAMEILTTHKDALDAISKRLMEVETLEREEYEALLKQHGVSIKDAYEEMYREESKAGDPTKALETTPKTDSQT